DKRTVSDAYYIGAWSMSEEYIEGQEYTVTVWGDVNEGQRIGLWFHAGSALQAFLKRVDDEKWQATFTARSMGHTNRPLEFSLYNYPQGSSNSAVIEKIKLEKGEAATDWSPAPEDGVSKNDLISEINIQADRQIFRVGDNRLMITEDSTYLDNAVIKSAHISDLAVTGAKIADASISSAKIISLDADQITGNTTNFIKSNCNNISTQISIDDRGINIIGSGRWRKNHYNQNGIVFYGGS